MNKIDIGDDHSISEVVYQDEKVGINVYHSKPDGSPCGGWVPFKGAAWDREFNGSIASWEVQSSDPLTLSPSILCRTCGDHGFIRNGRWVKA